MKLGQIWLAWKRIGQIIGDWIARIILTVFYFSIFVPFGLGVRLFGDKLAIKHKHSPQWLEYVTHDLTLDDARRLS
ncbi:MAG: hypothetical protein GY832_03205 [Chloroflexi bacterium]|nr:hypothetical protein [Chloroflexota bacterium]